MKITGKQKRYLRGLGHHLEALVRVGQNGITDGVIEAVRQALLEHELIKCKIGRSAPTGLKITELIDEVELKTPAVCVQKVGKTALFFAVHPEPEKRKIKLPKD